MLRPLALILALVALPAPARAQAGDSAPAPAAGAAVLGVSPRDSALDAQTRVLASELRCPVCQGQSLQDSGSELAREMRRLITDQLRAGRSPAQVRAYFVSKYGEWILLQPEAHGFNLAVYLLPLLGLLAGGLFIFMAARRWIHPPAAAEPGAGPSDPDVVGAAPDSEAEQPTATVPEDRS